MAVLFVVIICATAVFWLSGWMEKRSLPPSGGLFIPGEILLSGPQFLQSDPKWGNNNLGPTNDPLASVGCAVTSAAMVLAGYGIDTDPGRLNAFLTASEKGYTPEGWLYWETAALVNPAFAAKLLPHYEDKPSFCLIDCNLLRGNPVIIRLRYPSGVTHFMVICGKRGWDYLVRDPGPGGISGVYPLKDFGGPIEALRFYRKP
jgi:Peptidase_C39 like family